MYQKRCQELVHEISLKNEELLLETRSILQNNLDDQVGAMIRLQ